MKEPNKNSKGVLILRAISRHNKKNWHNRTTVLYTKYVRNTKNYFPPEQKNQHNAKNCIVL